MTTNAPTIKKIYLVAGFLVPVQRADVIQKVITQPLFFLISPKLKLPVIKDQPAKIAL